MKSVQGMVVLITGASSGFGMVTAKMLAQAGAKLVLGARSLDKLEALVAEIGEDKAIARACDVTKKQDLIDLAQEGITRFGRIDALVNNAGIMPLSPIQTGRTDDWDAMIDTNIKGVLYAIHAVLSHMMERGSGHIVNISSVAGLRTQPASSVYSGTKFAVRAISDGLRQEAAGKLQVTCIYPGAFATNLASTITDQATLKELTARFSGEGLIQPPERVAEAIIYALQQDEGVAVNEITIRPVLQGHTMIDLYYWPTPNGWKVSIMLEECDLEYKLIPIDIGGGDQFKPEFLRLSPNNRMPAIVDHDSLAGGAMEIFESGAILEYLAEKTGKFLPSQPKERYRVLQWLHWQMANLGPMMGNANHFMNYAKSIVDDPIKLEYGINRFRGEVDRLAGVMDGQLSATRYLGSDEYSIADIITWPWAMFLGRLLKPGDENKQYLDDLPHLKRWIDEVGARPAVQKGRKLGEELGQRKLSEEEQEQRRKLLFNQDNAKVRAAREKALRAD